MTDLTDSENFLKIIPLLKKLNLSDYGAIILFFYLLCKFYLITPIITIISNDYFLFIGFFLMVLGEARNSSSLYITYDNFPARISHFHELEMGSNTQVSIEITLDNESWKASLTKKLVKITNFYLILEYHKDQIELIIPQEYNAYDEPYGMRILVNKHVDKENFNCPMSILIKKFEDKKKLTVYLKPKSANKIFNAVIFFIYQVLYPQRKKILISI